MNPPPFKRGKIAHDKPFPTEDNHHFSACQELIPTISSLGVKNNDDRLLSNLPDDVLRRVTGFLDASSLVQMQHVNRYYHAVCRDNKAGWDGLCQHLWRDKLHVCPQAQNLQSDRFRAYYQSLHDAKTRHHVTVDELCYDPERRRGTIWRFRFKESAGNDWTLSDPWWRGQACRQMVFLRNGSVQQVVQRDNNNDVDNEEGFLTDADAADAALAPPQLDLIAPPLPMTWRFLTRPMDLPTRPMGSYVRFSVGGRDVPTYSVRRLTGNWGFCMESCWGLYASFELPKRQLQPPPHPHDERSDRTPPLLLPLPARNSVAALQNDAALLVTNEVQWREAFLYNVGARVLPEGDDATHEFDRAWGGQGNDLTLALP